MKRLFLLVAFMPLAFADLIFTPASFGGPYCLSPSFDVAACSITTEYDSGGVVFNSGTGTATFDDGGATYAWAGINAGIVDLLSPVDVQIVVPGTITQGVTSKVSVEAGFASAGNLLLSVFDSSHNLITSRVNGFDGLGPDGRSLITISASGIAFFEVSTPGLDTFGVNQIDIADVTAAGGGGGENVPEPASALLFGTGLVSLVAMRRRALRRH
jgi:PEP-CTERM motif